MASRIKLTDTKSHIMRNMSNELIPKIVKKLDSQMFKARLVADIRVAFRVALAAHPSWQSLSSKADDSLLGHFGIRNVQEAKRDIIDTWARGIVVQSPQLVRMNERFKITQKVVGIDDKYLDVTTLPNSFFTSRPSGALINWLQWLLTEGDRVIFTGWDASFDLNPEQTKRSRTGIALMVKGESWSVPKEHAGTKDRNMVTEAIGNMDKELSRIYKEHLTKAFR